MEALDEGICFSLSKTGLTCFNSVHADEADAVVSTEDFLPVESLDFCLEGRKLNFAVFRNNLVEGKEACIASGD